MKTDSIQMTINWSAFYPWLAGSTPHHGTGQPKRWGHSPLLQRLTAQATCPALLKSFNGFFTVCHETNFGRGFPVGSCADMRAALPRNGTVVRPFRFCVCPRRIGASSFSDWWSAMVMCYSARYLSTDFRQGFFRT